MPSRNFLVHTPPPRTGLSESLHTSPKRAGSRRPPSHSPNQGHSCLGEAALASQLTKTSNIIAHDAGVREDPRVHSGEGRS